MIYLDYNATTPVDEQVLNAMLPCFSKVFGNASSNTHVYGWLAKDAVDEARKQVAEVIGCLDQEIIFTSGATEAINLAIKGVYNIYQNKGKHIITCETEHKAVLDTCEYLAKKGVEITYLPVNDQGLIDLRALENAFTDKTILVAIMYANNETGVIQPVKEIAEIVHRKGAIFMSDATQAVGKIPVDVQNDNIDLLPISAHKIYGPKGVGALYIRRKDPRVSLEPLIHGGGHERGLRSGTLNVPGIVGLGKACEMLKHDDNKKIAELRDLLENALSGLPNIQVNGQNAPRLPNTSNITFKGIKAETLIRETQSWLAVATGSACTSAEQKPSHVLQAMGLSETEAYSSIRFSLGKYTTREEIEKTIQELTKRIKLP